MRTIRTPSCVGSCVRASGDPACARRRSTSWTTTRAVRCLRSRRASRTRTRTMTSRGQLCAALGDLLRLTMCRGNSQHQDPRPWPAPRSSRRSSSRSSKPTSPIRPPSTARPPPATRPPARPSPSEPASRATSSSRGGPCSNATCVTRSRRPTLTPQPRKDKLLAKHAFRGNARGGAVDEGGPARGDADRGRGRGRGRGGDRGRGRGGQRAAHDRRVRGHDRKLARIG